MTLEELLANAAPVRRVPAYEIPGAMSISGWSPGSTARITGTPRPEDLLRVLKTTPLMGSPGTVGPGIIEAETDPQKIAMGIAALRQRMAAAAAPGGFTRTLAIGDTPGGAQQAYAQSRQQNIQDWNAAQERIKDMVLGREKIASEQMIAAQNREANKEARENTLLGVLSRAGAGRGGLGDGTGTGGANPLDWVLKAILEAGTKNVFDPSGLNTLTGMVGPEINRAQAAYKTEWDQYTQAARQAASMAGGSALVPKFDEDTGAVTFEPLNTSTVPTAEQYQKAYETFLKSPGGPKVAATKTSPEHNMTLEDWRRALVAKAQQLEAGRATYGADLETAKFKYPHETNKAIDPQTLETVLRTILSQRAAMAAPKPVDPIRALLERRLGVQRPQ